MSAADNIGNYAEFVDDSTALSRGPATSMNHPKRIQLRRTKGWRKPEGAIVVARPSKWGNPFPIHGDWIVWTAVALGYRADTEGRRAASVALHQAWITGEPVQLGPLAGDESGGAIEFSDGSTRSMGDHVSGIAALAASFHEGPNATALPDLAPLVGHDLACWCPLDQPCHADVLLELANGAER